MKWLEVIKLRAAGKGERLLEKFVLSVDEASKNGLVEMKTYYHAALETDLSLHLYWESEKLGQSGSAFGLRLAQSLKDFGLVDHSIWIERSVHASVETHLVSPD